MSPDGQALPLQTALEKGDIPATSASARSLLCAFRHATCQSPGIVSSHRINKTSSQSLWLNLFPPVFNNAAGTGHYQNLAPDPSWALSLITAGMALGVGSELLRGLERCHQSFSFVTVPLGMTAKCSVLLWLLLCSQLSSCVGISCGTSGPGLQAWGWQVVYWYLADAKRLPMSLLFPTRRCFEMQRAPFFPHVWAPCGWHPPCHPFGQVLLGALSCSVTFTPQISSCESSSMWLLLHVDFPRLSRVFIKPSLVLYTWISSKSCSTALQLSWQYF